MILSYLFCILCVISSSLSTNSILFYAAPSTSYPYGFGVINNATESKPFTDSPLKGTIDGTCQMVLVNDDTVLVYGKMQYWGEQAVGGLLQFNLKTSSWSILGGGDDGINGASLISQEIEGAIAIPLSTNDVVVVGEITALPDNIDNIINNVATCNTVTGKCRSMGNGLPDYDEVTGMYALGTTVFISYITKVMGQTTKELKLVSWDGYEWTTWLNTTNTSPAPRHPYALTVHNQNLYLAGIRSITTNLCDNSTTSVKYLGVLDLEGICWTSTNTTGAGILEMSSIAVNSMGKLFAIINYQSAIAMYTDYKWVTIATTLGGPCNSFVSPFVVDSDVVYAQCILIEHGLDLALASITINSRTNVSLSILNKTICDTDLSVVSRDNQVWYECMTNNKLVLSQYNSTSMNYTLLNTVNDLYTSFPELNNLCAFGKKLFVKGPFSYAGEVLCPQNIAIWNSSMWTTMELNDYIPSNPLATAANGTNLLLAYPVTNITIGTWVRLAFVEHETLEVFYSDSPAFRVVSYQFTITGIKPAGRHVFILTTSPTERVLVYDIQSGNWSTNDFGLNGAGTINDIIGTSDELLVVGSFELNVTNVLYKNALRINYTSYQYLPIDPLLPGPIYNITAAQIKGTNATVYATGNILSGSGQSFGGVAGANENGIWIDRVLGGVPNRQFTTTKYLQETNSLYLLSDAFYWKSIYVYDGNTLSPIKNSGVLFIDIIDVPLIPLPFVIDDQKTSLMYYFIGGGSVILISFALIAIVIYRRHTKKKKKYIRIPEYVTMDVTSNILSLLDDRAIPKIDPADVEFGEIIGGGGQGIVQSAKWKGKQVAVKSLPFVEQKIIANFLQEIKLLSQLQHKNIVIFMGVMVKKDQNKIYLVTELMDCDLGKVANNLTYEEKLQIAKDVSKAMSYLHEQHPAVLHRDLKLNNILISRDGRCKITDFGISRTKPVGNMTITRNVGTLTFAAPEVLLNGKYNEKCDVYSMGIVLAELFGGKNPFAHVEYQWSLEFIQKFTSKEIEPELPMDIPPDILELIKSCLEWDPDKRPSFPVIVAKLKQAAPHFFHSLRT